ncbi:MAG: DUF86 domain-containing protein [Candidatus Marinimicrobia bacterium]|nr:DUF86 domain-containing protein [Candidatus Neomarinimicrobiota bacterium]
MVDQDIIQAKVAIIQRCLKRIAHTTGLQADTLADLDTQDIFVLNLQRASQAAIDCAGHVIADGGLGLPKSLKEHFSILETEGIISTDLTKKMHAMVGFRNIAVHEYENINIDILSNILDHHLKDLEEFNTAILNYSEL